MTLKIAFIISVAMHSALFLGSPNIKAPYEPDKKDKPIEVDYIVIKEERPKETAEVKAAEPVKIETPKVELKREVELKPSASLANAPIRSTRDYINYYQLIREKIRRRLKINYTDYSSEGEVRASFTLDRQGALIGLDIDKLNSTADKRLLDIAASSIREASPFAPFPKELNAPTMSFDLNISFKKR